MQKKQEGRMKKNSRKICEQTAKIAGKRGLKGGRHFHSKVNVHNISLQF